MTTTSEQRAQDPAALRAAMVSELRGDNIASEPVAAAFSVEPRHLFAPGEPLEAVYDSSLHVTRMILVGRVVRPTGPGSRRRGAGWFRLRREPLVPVG